MQQDAGLDSQHSEVWLNRPERGSSIAMRLITWMTLRFGRPVTRLLLHPLCWYFILFSPYARRASRRYLDRALGRRARITDVFKHYHAFASCLQDRIYLLAGRHDYFDVRIVGLETFDAVMRQQRGCMLLGAHHGSFEVLRALGMFDRKLQISVFSNEHQSQKVTSVLHRLQPGLATRVIVAGRPESLLRARECVERGEIVGILGDRAMRGEKAVACEFLGKLALFPEGPLVLAAIVQVPVLLAFGLYRGGRKYEIHFELLAEKVALDRRERSDQICGWVQAYATRLEHYCRTAPYNWFNFYDFWGDESE
ncbi:MAG: acyl-CoA synthetase [Burkholderiales bacterium]|nr:lipid A biosynthesis acyltransferase [Burkholderiales bacterium]MDQ3196585.1 lipid A biosynthesis acyltransferase [Pseudomonadota bacterium]